MISRAEASGDAPVYQVKTDIAHIRLSDNWKSLPRRDVEVIKYSTEFPTDFVVPEPGNKLQRTPPAHQPASPCVALLDTGSTSNCVRTSVAAQFNATLYPLEEPISLTSAVDHQTKVTHATVLMIRFPQRRHTIRVICFVVDELAEPLLLGWPFVAEHMELKLKEPPQDNTTTTSSPTHQSTRQLEDSPAKPPPKIEELPDTDDSPVDSSSKCPNACCNHFEYCSPDTSVKFISYESAIKLQREDPETELILATVHAIPDNTDVRVNRISVSLLKQEDPEQPADAPIPAFITADFADVVRDDFPHKAPPKRAIEHTIELQPDAKPFKSSPYRLSPKEKEELENQIRDLLDAGHIFPAAAPFAAPILFVRKKDGSRRLCVDFRKLNAMTVRKHYPIPLINDLFDQLEGATVFSKLDLISGYHQIAIAPQDQLKTAFVCHLGQFAWRVMPFGLCNAPSTFQESMDTLLRPYLRQFVLVYLDDILIYSKSHEEHAKHIRLVLETLRKGQFYAKRKKCSFFQDQIEFLGHIISAKGIAPMMDKIHAIVHWPELRSPKDAQQFLGLATYYRRFVARFSHIAAPLHQYAAGKIPWTGAAAQSFSDLKQALTSPPVLIPFDNTKEVRVTTDASNIAIGATLELLDDQRKVIGVVAYLSKVLQKNERNWPTRDKELFAIFTAVTAWRHYLIDKPFEIYTDHKSLEFLATTKQQEDRHVRWFERLNQFQGVVRYIKGKNNHVDALSRIELAPTDATTKEMIQVQVNSVNARYHTSAARFQEQIWKEIKENYTEDPFFKKVYLHLMNPVAYPIEPGLKTHIKRFEIFGDYLFYGVHFDKKAQLVVPDCSARDKIIELAHEVSGHGGPEKTFHLLRDHYFWPKMKVHVTNFARHCLECQRGKYSNQRPAGVMHPLDVPRGRWMDISIDFITGFSTEKLDEPPNPRQEIPSTADDPDSSSEPTTTSESIPDPQVNTARLSSLSQGLGKRKTRKSTITAANRKRKANGDPPRDPVPQGSTSESTSTPVEEVPADDTTDDSVAFKEDDVALPTPLKGIMVVVDRLTKMAHFIPTFKGTSARVAAILLLTHVIKLHGIPRSITSDRDPAFTSDVWRQLAKKLGIQLHMTVANRAQGDGNTERVNKTLIQMLRSTLRMNVHEWIMRLPLIELMYNSTYQESIGCTPFYAAYGYNINFMGMLNPRYDDPDHPLDLRAPENMAEHMQAILVSVQQRLAAAQDRQSIYYNRRHNGSDIQEGSKVLIHRDAYLKPGANRKFMYQYHGPFTVLKREGNVVTLNTPDLAHLPAHTFMRVGENTYNIDQVKPFLPEDPHFMRVPPTSYEDQEARIHEIAAIVSISDDKSTAVCRFEGCPYELTAVVPYHLIQRHIQQPQIDYLCSRGTALEKQLSTMPPASDNNSETPRPVPPEVRSFGEQLLARYAARRNNKRHRPNRAAPTETTEDSEVSSSGTTTSASAHPLPTPSSMPDSHSTNESESSDDDIVQQVVQDAIAEGYDSSDDEDDTSSATSADETQDNVATVQNIKASSGSPSHSNPFQRFQHLAALDYSGA